MLRDIVGPASASGAGFGDRDMQWHELKQAYAVQCAIKIQRLSIPGLEVKVMSDKAFHAGEF